MNSKWKTPIKKRGLDGNLYDLISLPVHGCAPYGQSLRILIQDQTCHRGFLPHACKATSEFPVHIVLSGASKLL